MYAFSKPIINQGSNNSTEIVIIVLFMCLVSLIVSTGVGIYFYTREETKCDKIEDSYDCKRNEKCKWNDDDSECEYDTDSDTDTGTDTDTDTDDSDTGVPYQISLSTDDNYCSDWGAIHQQVPGCGRICSSEEKRGIKTTDSSNWVVWGSEAGISSDCITASKIDKIWEVQSGSSTNRKLADGYTLSNYPAGTSVKCGKNDLRSDNNSVYRVSENGKLRHYPNPPIAASWDSDWNDWKTIGDCEGLTLGNDMTMKPSGDSAPAPYTGTQSGGEVAEIPHHCVLHDDAKSTYLSSFPSDHWPYRGHNSAEERWNHFYDSSILPSCTMKNQDNSDYSVDDRKKDCEAAKLTGGGTIPKFRNCQWVPVE